MKKRFVTISFILTMFMLISLCLNVSAYAQENSINEAQAPIEECIRHIEDELDGMGTNTIYELNQQILYYQNLYNETSNSTEREKIQAIISTTQSLLSDQ